MKKKIIGIFIIMLMISSTMTTIIYPETSKVQASDEEPQSVNLDFDWVWSQVENFSWVTNRTDWSGEYNIPKGRSWATAGENYTIAHIIKPAIDGPNSPCGLTNYTNLTIGYVSDEYGLVPGTNKPKEYSSKLVINTYKLAIWDDNSLYRNIPYNESFPIGVGVNTTLCRNDPDISLNQNYTFENVSIKGVDLFNWEIFPDHRNVSCQILNGDRPMIGLAMYIENNESIPENQDGYVFIMHEDPSCADKIANVTSSLGCILIANTTLGGYSYQESADSNLVIAKVNSAENNFSYVINQITSGYYYLVDNVLCDDLLTFSNYSNTSCFSQDEWIGVVKRLAPSNPLTDVLPTLGFKDSYYDFIWLELFNILSYWRNKTNLPGGCIGLILSDFGDTHFMTHTTRDWGWFGASKPGAKDSPFGNRWWIPMFSVNNSIGNYLIENKNTAKITGFITQKYQRQTTGIPGVISHNVVAYRNITKSPNNAIAVLSNRMDGWYGETSGDSGVGGALLLGIAKYFHDNNITPKYNLTFLFTTGEEYGMRGAQHYVDSHPYGTGPEQYNYLHFIGFDQLGFNNNVFQRHKHSLIIYTNNNYTKAILDESGQNQTKYQERTDNLYNFTVYGERGGGSEDYVWHTHNKTINTICFGKSNDWDGYHRAGNNFALGDSLQYIDRNDVNVTFELAWNITKYFTVNPDCWFDGTISYSGLDSPDDPDPKTDSISATFTVKSVLPHDKVRVNATVKSWPSNDVIFWKNYDFIVTSEGTQKTVIVTLPPDSTGASMGNYYLTLSLLNSTGRINDIAFNTRAYNDADIQTGYVYLYPRGNSDPDKPTGITCDSTIQSGEPTNFTTSTTDMNQDQMQYQWDWNVYLGDLIETTEVGPYDSGEDCPTTHTYIGCGPRVIQVRARDDYGYLFDGSTQGWNRYGDTWSDWSEPLEIWVHFFTDFSMSCTSFSSAVSAKYATELPSIQQINSMYMAVVFGCNDPFTYQWVFDQERYADQNKTVGYQFQETGEHLVSLNVTDDDGYFEEFSVNVSVVNLSASFNLSIPSPYANPDEEICFTDTSAIASGYQMSNWTWDFDDGTCSYDQNATHEFISPGAYNVSLTVTDNQSRSDVASKLILVSTDETPPQIQQVIDEITIDDRWLAVYLAGYFVDSKSGIKKASVNITYPNGSHGNFTMMHVFNTMYGYTFNDTNTPGQYNYTVWVTDYENNTSNATGYNFTIPEPPVLLYTTTTPADNTSSNDNWVNVNVTVVDPLNTSAFIDWNHSLKGYWPMESYNDTGVYDNSTYENFGTFQNGMNTRNIVAGKYGDGLEFDGSDDYVDVGTSDSLDLGTGDFTFMVWEKSHTTLYSKKAIILTNCPAMESWKGYGFGIINNPYLIVSESAGNNVTLQGTADVTDNTWHHIAYVCRSGVYSIYVDGEEDASSGGIAVKNITNAQHTMIAYDGHCSSWCYFEGTLDEPQLYNRALSWEEINASYNNGINRLYHNFTGLSDGTYSYSAHAIDTTGNQSNTEVRQILIDTTPPTITDVTASPHTVGFGYPVTITTDVSDNGSGVDLVTVQIAHPDGGNSSNHTMTFVGNDTFQFVFNDTWLVGQYNYTIWAMDNAYNINISTGHHFHVSADVSISIATLQDSYTSNQYINITDPPNPPENYTLVGRGLTWDEYYNALTGQNILETYQGPVNYQEENEIWTPINNTISQLAENHPAYVYGYRSGNNRGLYGAYFKSNAQQEWPVAFTFNRSDDPTIYAIRSKLVGVGYVDPQSNWAYQYLQNVQSSQGQVSDYSITYPAVFTGTDVTWSYGNIGLKEEITMSNTTKAVLQNHPPSQYGLNDASSYLVFITKLDYQNLNLYNDSGFLEENVTISENGVEFRDLLGQFKCALPLGEAYELNNESARQNLTYRIIHLNGNTYLLSGLKVSDLNAMTFPVVIDPTLTVYSNSNDGYIYSYSSASYSAARNATSGTIFNTSSSITIGQYKRASPTYYYVYRGYLFFNTTALPQNAYIDNATLSLYKYLDSSTTDFEITVQNGQPTYPHNPLQTTDYNKNLYSGNGGSKNTSSLGTGYNAIYLNSDGKSWMNRTGWTKLCLRSNRDINGYTPTGNEHVYVYSSEQGLGYQPKLVITYRNQSKIKNTGSTDITGYLLLQIQFYDSGKGTAPHWIIDNDTINETTTRTIISGNQLALDTIFNGHVRASDLTHGTGTYRVYAVFRDPEGNILRTNDGSELKAWWQFSKT